MSRPKLNDNQRAALRRIASLPYQARYDNGVTRYGVPRLVGVSHKGISPTVANTLARHGWLAKRQRLPHFKEGTQIVFVYEITALGRAMLA